MKDRKGAMLKAVALAGAMVAAPILRARCLRWGATDDETTMALPGDEFIAYPDLTATRAITIGTGTDEVWPWIAQLGQGRGGFYSYDALENLVGCNIHSADRIVAEWQHITVDDVVYLYPGVGLTVVAVQPERALVLRGAVPGGSPYDFTWSFVLLAATATTTRLVVRERYGYKRRRAALLVEPVELVSFVMTQRMLRGIRDRAEGFVPAAVEQPAW